MANGKGGSKQDHDVEELPEDFFDEFSNAEFMDGLNVVDTWKEDLPKDIKDDLRDLLRSRKEVAAGDRDYKKPNDERRRSPRRDRTRRSGERSGGKRSPERAPMRRDADKTNRDIRRDKETKVKEYLAKRLESDGPPGTELDDYLDEKKRKRRRSPSPVRKRRTPLSPLRSHTGRHLARRDPLPQRQRRRRSRSHSPSPLRDRQRRRSRSRSRGSYRSRSRSRGSYRSKSRSNSPYGFKPPPPPVYASGMPYGAPPMEAYAAQPFPRQEYASQYYPPAGMPEPPAPFFPGPRYSYGSGMPPGPVGVPPPVPYYEPAPGMVPPPQPVPPPLAMPMPTAVPTPAPSHIPPDPLQLGIAAKHTDLDQLLEDGTISKEDYMKLKPKNRASNIMDLKEKVNILTRCHDAVKKLAKLHLPNRLIMSNLLMASAKKAITPKFCSPLKRQPIVNFTFTSAKSSALQAQNKQLVDSIIATIGLQNVVSKPIKKETSKFKDAGSQTTTPFCESCEIRQMTKCNDKSTSVDSDHFSTSVHTQVIEVDLASSKSMFTPSGNSNSESGSISLAHLTPAQLIVSQLAARAKKLEPPPPEISDSEQYTRRIASSHNYYGSQGQGSRSNYYDGDYRY